MVRLCGLICLHLNSSLSFVLFLPVLLCLFGLEFNNTCENLSFILKCVHTNYFAVVFPLSDYKYLVGYTVYSSLFRLLQNSEVCHEALLTVWRRMFRRKEAGVVSGLQPGYYSSLTAPNLQPTANQVRNNQCANQHYSRELLMMGIVVPETCWAYKKYNQITSGI